MDNQAALEQLDRCLADYDPTIQTVMRTSLEELDRLLPGAIRLVYDNWNATVVGYTPDGKPRHAIGSLAAYPRWVNLFFFVGDALADPRLKGSGSTVRSIRLTGPADLDDHARSLVIRAASLTGWQPDAGAAIETRIAAISDKRKPRGGRGR